MFEVKHLPISIYTRPQAAEFIDRRTGEPIEFDDVEAIALHWLELPNWREEDAYLDFVNRAVRKAFGSANALCGFEKLIEMVRDLEYCWHVGSRYYTPWARKRFGPDPGSKILSLEMVHTNWDGEPPKKTEWMAEHWCAMKCEKYGLNPFEDIMTHWHVTWKRTDNGPCHRWYVEDPARLLNFQEHVKRMMSNREFTFA